MSVILVPMRSDKYHMREFAKIDPVDWSAVSQYNWHGAGRDPRHRYALAHEPGSGHRHILIAMHRLIANPMPSEVVDHINGDGFDNRRANLRTCTRAENAGNIHAIWGVSKYKGVCFTKSVGRWRATISVNRKAIFLGDFPTEIEAASAYDDAAIRYKGLFARTNKDLGLR